MSTKKNTAKNQPAESDGSMKSALRKECERFVGLRTKGNRADIEAKYECAAIVLAIENDVVKYGDGAVAKLADFVKVDKSLLYKEAKVVREWTLQEVRELATKGCGAVSWTHLVVLANAGLVNKKRDALIRQIADGGLSVDALKASLRPQPIGSNDTQPIVSGARSTEAGGFRQSASRTIASFEHFKSTTREIDAFITDVLTAVDPSTLGEDDVLQMIKLRAVAGENAAVAAEYASTLGRRLTEILDERELRRRISESSTPPAAERAAE